MEPIFFFKERKALIKIKFEYSNLKLQLCVLETIEIYEKSLHICRIFFIEAFICLEIAGSYF